MTKSTSDRWSNPFKIAFLDKIYWGNIESLIVSRIIYWGTATHFLIRSEIIWEEMKKRGRWKALKLRQCEELEGAWNLVQRDQSVGKEPNYQQKVGDLEVRWVTLTTVHTSASSFACFLSCFIGCVWLLCLYIQVDFHLMEIVRSIQVLVLLLVSCVVLLVVFGCCVCIYRWTFTWWRLFGPYKC